MRPFSILFCLSTSVLLAAAGYRVVKTVPLPGDSGWDYVTVDSEARRVYVTHGTDLIVLNADSGDVAGQITKLKGIHGVALAPELGRGFISNGQSGKITVFNTRTLARLDDEVAAGKNPDAIIYDPSTGRVFAFNGQSSDATVIDAELLTVTGTVSLQGKPEFAVADGIGAVYVNLEDKHSVARINARSMLVETTYDLAPCESPSGLALDAASRRLFAGCHNQMMAVVSADNGKLITTLPICSGIDATAFDPDAGLIFNSCSDGKVSVYHEDSPDHYTAQDTIETRPGSRTMAVDFKTHKLFLPAAQFEEASAPPPDGPAPRRRMRPGTFGLLVLEP